MDENALMKTALSIRNDFEEHKIDKTLLELTYGDYLPESIQDIERFLSVAEAIFPKSNCGIASSYIKIHYP